MNFMLYFTVTLFRICFCLAGLINGICSHVHGDIIRFKLPIAKMDMLNVLYTYQDKFNHVIGIIYAYIVHFLHEFNYLSSRNR